MKIDRRAIVAAQNNADWYEAVFAAHDLKFTRWPFALVGQGAPLPYYANLTVVEPNHSEEVKAELADLTNSFNGVLSLKDSFCELELDKSNFETLFEASWIWRAAQVAVMPDDWHVVENADQLSLWENAWKTNGSPTPIRMFPDAILERPDVFFLGKENEGQYIAGCIANLSDNCIGLSNVFTELPLKDSFAEAANAAGTLDVKLPTVGYESGVELDFAASCGFQTVGDLRILVTKAAKL